MFACRWFEVFLLVWSVASVVDTCPGQKMNTSFLLSQAEAEEILRTETILRRYIIRSLTDVREKIFHFKGFDSAVSEIIEGLEMRDVNPFKSLGYDNSTLDNPNASNMVKTIFNLQRGRRCQNWNFSDWNSLLQTIPDKHPNLQITPEHLLKIQEGGEWLVGFILTEISKSSLKANSRLLSDVLYNYRFRQYSPELISILDNINQTLSGSLENFSDFHPVGTSTKPDEILSDILKFISRRKESDQAFVYQIARVLSALSVKGNTAVVKDASRPEDWFDFMSPDDYPPDIIQAKNAVASAVRNNRTGVDLSGLNQIVKGRSPIEKLLMLIAKLSSIPTGSPLSREVLALHPHIKLRHLTNEGKFFKPRTSQDVQFLFDSFLTGPEKVDSKLAKEVLKVFVVSDWEAVLKDFDYSRYSKPRTLVLDMLQRLLDGSNELPICSIIIARYFLRKNISPSAEDFFGEFTIPTAKSRYPLKPIFEGETSTATVSIPPPPFISYQPSNSQRLQESVFRGVSDLLSSPHPVADTSAGITFRSPTPLFFESSSQPDSLEANASSVDSSSESLNYSESLVPAAASPVHGTTPEPQSSNTTLPHLAVSLHHISAVPIVQTFSSTQAASPLTPATDRPSESTAAVGNASQEVSTTPSLPTFFQPQTVSSDQGSSFVNESTVDAELSTNLVPDHSSVTKPVTATTSEVQQSVSTTVTTATDVSSERLIMAETRNSSERPSEKEHLKELGNSNSGSRSAGR